MSAGPYYNLMEAATKNAIACIAPVLVGLRDENDAPYNPPIPLRSVFSQATAEFAEVVCAFEMGAGQFSWGKNLLEFDETTGAYYHAIHSDSSRIVLTVKARSDAERRYLADALLGGIVAGYSVDAYGNAVEGSVIDNLAFVGIIPTGWDLAFPEPDLSEPRPEGQVYQAVLSLTCQSWHRWDATPGRAVGGIRVQPSFTPDPASQGPAAPVVTDSVIVVQ